MWIQKAAGGIDAFTFAPDGRHLYIGDSAGKFTEWDVTARTPRKLFEAGEHAPAGVFCAAGGRFLVVRDSRPVIREIASGAVHARLDTDEPSRGHIISPGSLTTDPADDARLLLLTDDGTLLRTWDTVTRAFVSSARAWRSSWRVKWFDVSADGRLLAVARVGPSQEVVLIDRVTGAEVRSFHVGVPLSQVRFSPDGTTLAVMGSWKVWLWDIGSNRSCEVEGVPSRHENPAQPFALSPTAPLVAALNAAGAPTLFDRATGRPLRSFDFALGKRVTCVAFSPDGLTCAVGGSNKQFAVFDVDL